MEAVVGLEQNSSIHALPGGKRVLIINHKSVTGFKNLSELLENLTGVAPQSVDYEQVSQVENIDYIILCGGNTYAVKNNSERLKKEIEIIKSTDKPVLGICYGFQVIAAAYGGDLQRLSRRRKGIFPISLGTNKIFHDVNSNLFWENHIWSLKNVEDSLEVLATSDNGIEAVKVHGREVYGMQFHPESKNSGPAGLQIMKNFLGLTRT
jgi:GMP synthase (glutamine-hydrolysing)